MKLVSVVQAIITIWGMQYFCNGENFSAPPFPLLEFMSLSKTSLPLPWHVNFNTSLCTISTKHRCCSCNIETCMKFKDCCIDAVWGEKNKSPQPALDLRSYLTEFVKNSKQMKPLQCLSAFPLADAEGLTSLKYLMVTTCLPQSDLFNQMMCLYSNNKSIDKSVPVLGDDNFLYKNSFCARCNNVDEFRLVNVTMVCRHCRDESIRYKNGSYRCTDGSNKLIKIDQSRCHYEIFTKSSHIRICEASTKRLKCIGDELTAGLCNAYKGFSVGNFSNYHCFLCGDPSAEKPLPKPSCLWQPIPFSTAHASWSKILHFSESFDSDCPEDSFFNQFERRCAKFTCRRRYHIKNGACVRNKDTRGTRKFPPLMQNKDLSKCLFSKNPTLYLDNADIMKNKSSVLENLSTLGVDYRDDSSNQMVINFINKDEVFNEMLLEYFINEARIQQSKQQFVLSISAQNPLQKVNYSSWLLFPNNHVCAKAEPVNESKVTTTPQCDILYNDNILQPEEVWTTVSTTNTSVVMYKCNLFYLTENCPLGRINSSFSLLKDGQLEYSVGSRRRVFQMNEYIPLEGGGYGVCAKDISAIDTVETVDEYISVVGSSISVCCYIVIILTFACFKQLLNIPSLCTLNLCVCLLCNDILFLISLIMRTEFLNEAPTLCKMVGILMEFSLIAAYVWGVVLSIDISLTLTRRTPYERNKRKTMYRYCGGVLAVTMMIVITSVVIGETGSLDISYNKHGVCVQQGHVGRLIFYFVPVITCFVFSFCVLTISLYKLSHYDRENKIALSSGSQDVRSSHGRALHLRKVSLKLIVVCGLTELIGVVYIYKESPTREEWIANAVFSLLYSAVRSLRGLMLFVVYVLGRKDVKDLYRKKVLDIVSQGRDTRLNGGDQMTSKF